MNSTSFPNLSPNVNLSSGCAEKTQAEIASSWLQLVRANLQPSCARIAILSVAAPTIPLLSSFRWSGQGVVVYHHNCTSFSQSLLIKICRCSSASHTDKQSDGPLSKHVPQKMSTSALPGDPWIGHWKFVQRGRCLQSTYCTVRTSRNWNWACVMVSCPPNGR